MPPKKDAAAGADSSALLKGFENKEVKLLAAAFLSSVGPDKFDYEVMSTLTGNTAGSLKKMWPPVKKKAMESNISFAKFLGASNLGNPNDSTINAPKPAAAPKANAGRKRKTAEPDTDADSDSNDVDVKPAGKKGNGKTVSNKKAPAKGRGRAKKVKEEPSEDEELADGSVKSAGNADQDNGEAEV